METSSEAPVIIVEDPPTPAPFEQHANSEVNSTSTSGEETALEVLDLSARLTRLQRLETEGDDDGRDALQLAIKQTIRHHLNMKCRRLLEQSNVISLKAASFKRMFDLIQISVIISSSITLAIESVSGHMKDDPSLAPLFIYVPIALSLWSSLSLSVLRFFNLDARLQGLKDLLAESMALSTRLKQQRELLNAMGSANDLLVLYKAVEKQLQQVAAFTAKYESEIRIKDSVVYTRKYRHLKRQLKHRPV